MSHRAITFASTLALGLALAPTTFAAPTGCPYPQRTAPPNPAIRVDTVRAQLRELLAAEGYPADTRADISIRPFNLDRDSRTQEALVDVMSPRLCSAFACPTLVVLSRNGRLQTAGSGAWLTVNITRTKAGWFELIDNAPVLAPVIPFPTRVVWNGTRYHRMGS